ncbi:FadR/GntR family transcriptional regulator [Rhizobium binae]|uniref:DNA-binding FadR family transcriptional regulator n=1 Tax=Rhizobium binae TaxID=1138190 RepID=A0ABV2MPU9_9HYPH|nr:FadR/GntR family transcriptional regulator [Rhizobium binae]NKL51649.1 GntR family transcriptional regulator [Rhizobium leguminosarum bv. viciae]MBX4936460.1 FadR family transcriptional regulator [Rhizobium binae]MBX4942783.1 FadR family transcriptional regulator [Rhizobium binae]MBX4949774.1 FadR family transcriptional regulator [Rhizobium binae]MBX4961665.1 FadR family transcriptional regulator [Rhizobium binae]
MFSPVESRRLYRQVADQIRLMIASGELAVGQRLPAERELAEQLSVSRPTVREALIVLEVEGLVNIRMGSGIYVVRRHAANAGASDREPVEGPFELLQARAIIECAIAEEAAGCAKPEGVALLDEALMRMSGGVHEASTVLAADRAFHTGIAAIVGNATLVRVTGEMFDMRMTPYFAKLASHFEGPTTWRSALVEHQAIRNAIAAGDTAGAKAAMRVHLTMSQKRFSESFGEEFSGEEERGRNTRPAKVTDKT